MNQINLISATLCPHLSWNGARITFLSLFLVAIMRVGTVNLAKLPQGFMGQVLVDSCEKRLQRLDFLPKSISGKNFS
jgi:hypothetical protein